ncbi:MAG: hypothetical protein MUQ52_04435 [Pirellulales bacterium]|nr:hypothetical protein [Pirellulales bacterium]
MPKQISRKDSSEGRLISVSLPPRKTMITKLTLACTLFVALFVNAHTAQAADLGIGLIPDDAAFLASTLRGREQYDRIVASNAFASLKELKSVAKALDELAKQQTQPGNPMAIAMMMMQMPDNQEALALLKDMVATDTFVFGTSSWVTVSKLFKKLQSAQQAANIATITKGTDLEIDAESTLNQLLAETLAANTDQIVIPDLVWGFQTTQVDAAQKQLERIETFVTGMAQAQPMLADAVVRKEIGNGDFITVTIKPDPTLLKMAMSNVVKFTDMEEELEKIMNRINELQIVVALGVVKEHVVLSIGGGTEHLQAMGSTGGSLLDTKPFKVVRDATEKPLTSIWYRSQKLAKAWETSPEDIEQAKKFAAAVAKANDLTPEATAEAEELVGELLEGYASQMPEAGPWLAYSYLTDTGYAGEEWNWAKNIPWNGSTPLSLDHFGGNPLAVIALRTKTDPKQFEAFVNWTDSLRKFVSNAIASTGDDDVQEGFKTFDEKIVPLGEELTNTVREKFVPALKNGQFGLVLDGKASTTKLQASLPASSKPLPLIEPAIVFSLDDEALFREGLSDIFALSDKLLAVIREIDEDAIPSEYRIPDPEEKDAEGGSLWTFALPESELDEQIQLSIGVGKNAAVFSFTPTQAERILTSSPLQLEGDFSQNLAAAAILDWVAFANLLEPWATYVIRCGGMQQEKGRLDPDSTIGPDSETEEVTDALEQLATIFDVVRCLKSATAKTSIEEDATVTRWQNRIEDLPAK